ncbi:ubiquinol-cytochrome c reductase cytochrome b subunit [Paragonimus westermani]|uniref:Cytochrome b n=1 Tax=Paragonimus westermani TaxID=34504 RepID=A0A5J4N4Z0_9TREM|nr:ubiquinol-cytochrome c reductase cytochrome b subunit [Paragonimus westermani]
MLSVLRHKVVDLPTNLSLNYFLCGCFMIRSFLASQLVSVLVLSLLYVGFVLYLLMMIEAFLGYILPWHQMSISIVGTSLYSFIVGVLEVTNATLVRVFSARVCLAFVVVGFRVIHHFYLHKGGSNKSLFITGGYKDVVLFHRFFMNKNGLLLLFLLGLLSWLMWVCPDMVLDVERYLQVDPLVTPVSIKPEWYFLAFYAMLQSIESKVGGFGSSVGFSFCPVVAWF